MPERINVSNKTYHRNIARAIRLDGMCGVCKWRDRLQAVPIIAQLGFSDARNLATLCEDCVVAARSAPRGRGRSAVRSSKDDLFARLTRDRRLTTLFNSSKGS